MRDRSPHPLMTKLPHPRLQQLLALLHAEPLPQEELARRLVVRGFFGEIIHRIPVEAVRERLTDAIERELALTETN